MTGYFDSGAHFRFVCTQSGQSLSSKPNERIFHGKEPTNPNTVTPNTARRSLARRAFSLRRPDPFASDWGTAVPRDQFRHAASARLRRADRIGRHPSSPVRPGPRDGHVAEEQGLFQRGRASPPAQRLSPHEPATCAGIVRQSAWLARDPAHGPHEHARPICAAGRAFLHQGGGGPCPCGLRGFPHGVERSQLRLTRERARPPARAAERPKPDRTTE